MRHHNLRRVQRAVGGVPTQNHGAHGSPSAGRGPEGQAPLRSRPSSSGPRSATFLSALAGEHLRMSASPSLQRALGKLLLPRKATRGGHPHPNASAAALPRGAVSRKGRRALASECSNHENSADHPEPTSNGCRYAFGIHRRAKSNRPEPMACQRRQNDSTRTNRTRDNVSTCFDAHANPLPHLHGAAIDQHRHPGPIRTHREPDLARQSVRARQPAARDPT